MALRTVRLSRRSVRLLKAGGGGVVAIVALSVPLGSTPAVVQQLSLLLVYAIALLGLNLLVGYSGQVSLAHSAFFAVGAYTGAILVAKHDQHWLLPLVVAGLVTFVLGFLAGLPAIRLKGLYLAMVTFAMALAVPPLAIRLDVLTGGNHGIVLSPQRFAVAGLAPDQVIYYLCLAVAAIGLIVVRNLVVGQLGLALAAVRVNEFAAAAHGVSAARIKTLAFAWSAMYAGVAGCLFAYVTGFVAPDSFTYILGISMLAAAVIGGTHSLAGAFVGAAYIEYLPQVAGTVNENLVGVVYGVALVLVVLIAPKGVMGVLKSAWGRHVRVTEEPRPVARDPGAARAARGSVA